MVAMWRLSGAHWAQDWFDGLGVDAALSSRAVGRVRRRCRTPVVVRCLEEPIIVPSAR